MQLELTLREHVAVRVMTNSEQIKRTRQYFVQGERQSQQDGDDDARELVASPWAQHLKPSPTLAVKAVADQLKRSGLATPSSLARALPDFVSDDQSLTLTHAHAGVEVFDFGVGEMNPFIPVPHALREAIAAAQLADAHSHYTAAPGTHSPLTALALWTPWSRPHSPTHIVRTRVQAMTRCCKC
jgi:hypothetical protein